MMHTINRRQTLCLLSSFAALPVFVADATAAPAVYTAPETARRCFGMNSDWRFIRQDVPGAAVPGFDDSAWATVGLPHTYNDIDTFDEITHSGEWHEYTGVAWYRKRFNVPAIAPGGRVFLEFEGLKQAAHFSLNGKPIGLFENGVTACGLDITDAVRTGDTENVLAVRVTNDGHYVEEATGVGFEWMSKDFDPNFGGLNHNAWLHITGPVYQTLPLYLNLGTTGTYIYAKNFSVPNRSAEVTVESQVRNDSASAQSIGLSAVIVDAAGRAHATLPESAPMRVEAGATAILSTTAPVTDLHFWDDQNPSLYTVYSILTVDGRVVDAVPIVTGFRKTEFRGGAGKGGVYINDRFVYLRGYAQRSTNEWAGLGQAYPDWMHDYHAALIRGSNANYIRWMHITPARIDVSAGDRHGIVQIMPAGDKEGDATGRQWDQRVEVMRASMIYLRNHPSILFYESGNNGITAAHMGEMRALKEKWDPNGGRAIGCRSLSDEGAIQTAEYYGTMVTEDARLAKPRGYTDAFRGYSDERRDRGPLLEAEDFRDEAARRFWDNYSPPTFGFHKKPKDTYDYNSESFCIAAVARYNAYFSERISNPDPAHSKWSGYASIIFSDSNSHGRQYESECCRVSGKVDAVRLPKQAYFTYRAMQNPLPDLHLIGHWTYPAGTRKTVYVISNCEAVELRLNGRSLGTVKSPTERFVFAFPEVVFEPGSLSAVGFIGGKTVARMTLATSGPPVAVRLTPILSPAGLRADGADVALVDFEVVDARGRRCPTDEARVDFALTGPAIWRGGYNSGIPGSTNNLYLNTECGINRVAVRSTRTPGAIILRARRPGLKPASLTLTSQPVRLVGGLAPEASV